jgi:heme-degrading monooxygenase HmoA
MIVERAELPISPGREQEFEEAFRRVFRHLTEAKGCRGASLARGVESPTLYRLLIEWDSLEAHQAFTRTPGFEMFKAGAGPFFAGKPNTQHFTPLADRA